MHERHRSNYTDFGIVLSGILAYGTASMTYNFLDTGEFFPKKQSNTATAVGVVTALVAVSSRVLTVKRHGSPGMFGVGAITTRQRKELDEIEAQLRKASKMHASQADRISQISGPVNVF